MAYEKCKCETCEHEHESVWIWIYESNVYKDEQMLNMWNWNVSHTIYVNASILCDLNVCDTVWGSHERDACDMCEMVNDCDGCVNAM